MRTLTALLCCMLVSPAAWAQDDQAARTRARDFESEIIREVERGYFLKAGLGSNQFLGAYGNAVRPVIATNLAVGSDFVDNEKTSLAWEFLFAQALHNGPKVEELADAGNALLYVEGDVHTFAGIVMIEASAYPFTRLGLGGHAGGGVMFVPILMEQAAFDEDVVTGAWNLASGTVPTVHAGPLPMVAGGFTLEYYTKLSHFSIGTDVDVYYVIGFDLALAPSGYLKYTF